MSANSVPRVSAVELQAQRERTASLRLNLVLGCAITVAAALALGTPAASVVSDAELANLLRGMAAIKALIVIGTFCLLHWRFGRSLSPRLAGAYLTGVWLIAGASAMIWQLAQIAPAAFAFHLGAFVLLATAWRDRSY